MPNSQYPDLITGEINNTSSVATFDELQEWYNSTKEGRTLWNGANLEKWSDGFIRFYQANGFVPIAGNSIFVRTDVNTALGGGSPLYLNKSTNPNVVKEFGTTPSVPTWNKGSAVTGSTSGNLTGGTARVGQQLVETKINESTGVWETATVGGTIVGTMTLGDLLLGSALGIGLGVKFVDFFPDQATDFSNFCLLPMINAGIIEPATYETTRVGLSNVLREHNDEQGNKLITPYAPYESIEKGLQYLLKIGAFVSDSTINPVVPIVGNKPIYDTFTDGSYIQISDFFWNRDQHQNEYRVHKDDIINAFRKRFDEVVTFDNNHCYTLAYSPNFSGVIDTFEMKVFESNIIETAKIKSYKIDNSHGNAGNFIKITLDDTPKKMIVHSIYVSGKNYQAILKGINEATINSSELNFNTTFGSSSDPWIPYYYGGAGFVQSLYSYSDSTVLLCSMQTEYTTLNNVNGLQFTDYTPLINDINDLTVRLQEWKNKNGFKISTPSYDENGKPNGIRDQWYLPIPTPDPSAKTSPDYTTPSGLYEPTNVPDDDTDLQNEILDRLKDIENQLPSNPEYKPTPTPPSDDTGEINTPSSILGNNGQGLWSVYNPSLSQINEFGAWLWSSNIWEQIRQYFSDPMQGIIGLHKIFCKPTNGDTKTIIAGYLDSGVSSPTVTKQYERIDCGSLACAEYYGNALDYAPYTDVAIYLPFVGVVSLNVNEVMGSILHVYYDVDILTGACLATIEVKDSSNIIVSLYQYNGVCAVQIPLTSGNYGSVIASLVTTGAGVIATVASGGALAPVLIGGAASALSSGTNIKQSGSIGSNVGAMAQKKPYLIISRKIPYMALNYNNFEGFPSNNNVYIGNLTGYVRTKKVYIASNIATQNEKEMIEELLNDGVYV